VTKPLQSRAELLARVKALLRRPSPPPMRRRTIESASWRLIPASYRVSHSGKPVPAQPRFEFRAALLLSFRAQTASLLGINCSIGLGNGIDSLPAQRGRLRLRLREKNRIHPENPMHLKTVRGAGYLFETRAA